MDVAPATLDRETRCWLPYLRLDTGQYPRLTPQLAPICGAGEQLWHTFPVNRVLPLTQRVSYTLVEQSLKRMRLGD
jgi:hypothetical protein